MLSTQGREGLCDKTLPRPGPVWDARKLPHLAVGDYEFVHAEKPIGAGKIDTTWTWRISPRRYKEWESVLIEWARQGDLERVKSGFEAIRHQPMAAGVRAQVFKLEAETNKFLRKRGTEPVNLGELPIMARTTRKSMEAI